MGSHDIDCLALGAIPAMFVARKKSRRCFKDGRRLAHQPRQPKILGLGSAILIGSCSRLIVLAISSGSAASTSGQSRMG